MTKHRSEGGKVIIGLASPMPRDPNDDTPLLTDNIANLSPTSLLQNGVRRVAGSYLFKDRVDTPGDLLAADVQAWDLRVDGIDPVADATFPEYQIAPPVAAINYLWNGTEFDRQTSAGAASLAADPVIGAMLVADPGEWTEFSDPALNTQATATRAAGAAGERHICKSISACLSAGATASGIIKIYLRDGATGVGPILWAGNLAVIAGFHGHMLLTDLNIKGSLATAMTLEFSAAGGATTQENVTLSGITVG